MFKFDSLGAAFQEYAHSHSAKSPTLDWLGLKSMLMTDILKCATHTLLVSPQTLIFTSLSGQLIFCPLSLIVLDEYCHQFKSHKPSLLSECEAVVNSRGDRTSPYRKSRVHPTPSRGGINLLRREEAVEFMVGFADVTNLD